MPHFPCRQQVSFPHPECNVRAKWSLCEHALHLKVVDVFRIAVGLGQNGCHNVHILYACAVMLPAMQHPNQLTAGLKGSWTETEIDALDRSCDKLSKSCKVSLFFFFTVLNRKKKKLVMTLINGGNLRISLSVSSLGQENPKPKDV